MAAERSSKLRLGISLSLLVVFSAAEGYPSEVDAASSSQDCWRHGLPTIPANGARSLGGELASRPRCISEGNGRVDCFYRGTDFAAHRMTIENGAASKTENMGGEILDEVECAYRGDRFYCLATHIGFGVRWSSNVGGKWSEWKAVAGLNAEHSPSCTTLEDSVRCGVRDKEGQLAIRAFDRDGPKDPKSSGVGLWTEPECIAKDETTSVCVYVNSDRNLVLVKIEIPKLTGQLMLRIDRPTITPLHTVVSMTTTEGSTIHVFGLDGRSQMVHISKPDEGKWSDPEIIEGTLSTPPECLTVPSGIIYCFALDLYHSLVKATLGRETWTEWEPVASAFIDRPSCVISDANVISCFSRGFTSEIVVVAIDF